MKIHFLLLSVLLLCISGHAQTDSSSDNKTKIAAGVVFNTNQSYAGRTDSSKLPVLIPEVNFAFPKGFFLNAKGYLNLSEHATTFDGISLEPGYELSKKNWYGSISVIKNFISDSSNLIIAPVNAALEFYLNKETKLLTPFIGWEYSMSGEGNDFILYGGLSKDIVFTKEDKKIAIDMEPSVSFTAGSQSFYYSYLKSFAGNGKASGKRKKQGNNGSGTSATATQLVEQESKKFTLLGSAFELPLSIGGSKLKWVTTPALETSLNLFNGTTATQGSSIFFYITTELTFSF